jgi:chorismate dehydratase
MKPIRLGAVDYLNARPLVYGLEMRNDLFALRYDVPSKCAALLHEGSIDVGMIPAIEYLRRPFYYVVPDIGIVSDGRVASVALFSTTPVDQVRSIAADISSRTSNVLLQILCFEVFGIDAAFHPMPPDVPAMLRRSDAALVIGDPALFYDHVAAGVLKTDLGEQWTTLTGLPFVWAFWAGRPEVVPPNAVAELIAARDRGVQASDAIAATYCGPDRAALGKAYLSENISYTLGEREEAGLRRYFELAEKHGSAAELKAPAYYAR